MVVQGTKESLRREKLCSGREASDVVEDDGSAIGTALEQVLWGRLFVEKIKHLWIDRAVI